MSDVTTDEDDESWPKTRAGTVDWEAVFEKPGTGFIPRIKSTTTARDLRHFTTLTIQRLFTRRGDEMQVDQFMTKLTAIIPDEAGEDQLPIAQDAVVKILREMKDLRKAKAQAFIDEQEKKAAIKAKLDDLRHRRRTDDEKTKEIFSAILGLAAACIVGIIVLTVSAIDFGGDEDDPAANHARFVDQMLRLAERAEINKPGPRGQHIYGGDLRVSEIGGKVALAATDLPPAVCAAASWSLSKKGLIVINGFAPKRVGPTTLSRLCHDTPDGARLVWVPAAQGPDK